MAEPDAPLAAATGGARRTAWSWLITAAATAGTVALHARFLALDEELPWEDAPAHLGVLVRWQHWFEGGWPVVRDGHSPLLYWTASATNQAWGPGLDAAVWAVVLFAGLLAAGMARVGFRLQGLSACALLPLLALATPQIAVYSRMFLLDLPAMAWLPWILLAVWTSQGFRRPLPTLGLGVALGGLALTKLQIGIWVMPLLMACGLWALLRSPWSVLPLAAAAAPMALVLQRMQASAAAERVADAVLFQRLAEHHRLLGASAFTVVVVAGLLRWRWPAGWRRLAPGVWLSLAAFACLALVAPWLTVGLSAIQDHALQVTGTQHHGLALSLQALRTDLVWTWVGSTTVWVGLAVGCGVLELCFRWPDLRASVWHRRLAGTVPGQAPLILLLAILGLCTWVGVVVTGNNLPIATRYFLPVWIFLVIGVGLAVCTLRLTRWTLAPVLGLAAVIQVAHADLLPIWPGLQPHVHEYNLVSDKRGRSVVPVHAASRSPVVPVPVGPHTAGAAAAYERLVTTARRAWTQNGVCGRFLFRSRLPSERRAYLGLGGMHGLSHCELDDLRLPLTTLPSPVPVAVLLLGLQEDAAAEAVGQLSDLTGWTWEARERIPLSTGGEAALYAPASSR